MSDIFISYASSDRPRVSPLVKALEQRGWSVWWDPTILPGKTWDKVIERALADARCVIVLWSRDSVKSDWVRSEADEAKRRGILVPALIDPVAIPLGFSRIQAANLVDWPGVSTSADFDKLVRAVAETLSNPTTAPVASEGPAREGAGTATRRRMALIGAPVLLCFAGFALYFANHRHADGSPETSPGSGGNRFAGASDSFLWEAHDSATPWKYLPSTWGPLDGKTVDGEALRFLAVSGTGVGLFPAAAKATDLVNYTAIFVLRYQKGMESASWVARARDREHYYRFTFHYPTEEGGFKIESTAEPGNDRLHLESHDSRSLIPFQTGDELEVRLTVEGNRFTHTFKINDVNLRSMPPKPAQNTPTYFRATDRDDRNRYSSGYFGFTAGNDAGSRMLVKANLEVKP